jgi:transposase
MSKNQAANQPYSSQFREQMVELVKLDRKPKELAQEFGCHETSIRSWVRQSEQGKLGCPVPLSADERQELNELRRKLRQVQQERDILAKATAWFANKSDVACTPSTR